MSHPAQLSMERLLADCEIKRTRGSGPGGQHRNKVETAVVVQHLPTGLRGEASERRSQLQNRQQAIFRLRVKLALQLRHEPESGTTALWQERTRSGRVAVSPQHNDFPALLAEALDRIHHEEYALPSAAEKMGVSSSQLVRLLKVEPAALIAVNRTRQAMGESPLR